MPHGHLQRASAGGGSALLRNNDQAAECGLRLGWHKNAVSDTTTRPAAGLLTGSPRGELGASVGGVVYA